MLQTKLNFKNTEIIPSILSDSNRMKLEINRKLENPQIWKLNTHLNNQGPKKKSKGKLETSSDKL